MQSLYKNWLLVLKTTWKIWTTSEKQWEVQKVEIPWALLPKKYIPSAKTLYAEDLSNITFNYLCESSPSFLCHFWNHKSFFTTQFLSILFSSNITYFLQHFIKVQICRVSTGCVKIHQISHVIFLRSLDHSSVSQEIVFLFFFS